VADLATILVRFLASGNLARINESDFSAELHERWEHTLDAPEPPAARAAEPERAPEPEAAKPAVKPAKKKG
jgi:hypothetical protein